MVPQDSEIKCKINAQGETSWCNSCGQLFIKEGKCPIDEKPIEILKYIKKENTRKGNS